MTASKTMSLVLVMAACGSGSGSEAALQSREDTTTRQEAAAPDTARPLGAEILIDEHGIGLARRGMRVGDLRRALPPDVTLGTPDLYFMVDLSAVPVIAGADTLYHLLFPALDALDDAQDLELVATLHGRARTAAGLGPGMTLAEAVSLLGPVTLSYSIHDESREYARFDAQPANIFFRVHPGADERAFAGIYSTDDEYNTTTRYDPDALISMVMVDLSRSSEAAGR